MMPYALVHEGMVLLTCEKFYVGRINAELSDLDIDQKIYPSMESQVPINISENTKLLYYAEHHPNINSKIETYDGPIYAITEDTVIANFYVRKLDLNIAKDRSTDILKQTRYLYENANITIKIPCICAPYLTSDIILDKEFLPIASIIVANTSRESRMVYSNKISLMAEGKINFKFSNGWLSITKSGLISVANEIDRYVQTLYDIEAETSKRIDSCTSLEELNEISLDPFVTFFQNTKAEP